MNCVRSSNLIFSSPFSVFTVIVWAAVSTFSTDPITLKYGDFGCAASCAGDEKEPASKATLKRSADLVINTSMAVHRATR
jgi:hypothetical protein